MLLPAAPFIDARRLDGACAGRPEYGPVPFILLASLVAHSTIYFADWLPSARAVWSNVLQGLDDDYRLPRLWTIQSALCILNSRPAENAGQGDIGLARVSRDCNAR